MNNLRAQEAEAAGFTVRTMSALDTSRVAKVHLRVWRQAYSQLMPADYLAALDERAFAQSWHTRLSGPPMHAMTHLVGLEPTGNIVAIGSAGPSRDPDPPMPYELYALNVLAQWHGTGLADLMISRLLDGHPASLWVARENSRARRFYGRHDFWPDGASKEHEPTGLVEVRLVRRPMSGDPRRNRGTRPFTRTSDGRR